MAANDPTSIPAHIFLPDPTTPLAATPLAVRQALGQSMSTLLTVADGRDPLAPHATAQYSVAVARAFKPTRFIVAEESVHCLITGSLYGGRTRLFERVHGGFFSPTLAPEKAPKQEWPILMTGQRVDFEVTWQPLPCPIHDDCKEAYKLYKIIMPCDRVMIPLTFRALLEGIDFYGRSVID